LSTEQWENLRKWKGRKPKNSGFKVCPVSKQNGNPESTFIALKSGNAELFDGSIDL
jgi:hypothetical protein